LITTRALYTGIGSLLLRVSRVFTLWLTVSAIAAIVTVASAAAVALTVVVAVLAIISLPVTGSAPGSSAVLLALATTVALTLS
tara:strand:+ start:228 stop:476 length:249 start_codon:yes stop_codon:yes gene_type:complete